MKYQSSNLTYNNISEPGIATTGLVYKGDKNYNNPNEYGSNFLVNCIDINWGQVEMSNGQTITSSGDLLNIISTIAAFIDIIMSVNPSKESDYVYIGSTNGISSLLKSTEKDPDTGFPIYHLKDELINKDETSDLVKTYMNNIAKKVESNVDTVIKDASGAFYGTTRKYDAKEEVCYVGPLEFIQKFNSVINKTCFRNSIGKMLLYCTKNNHDHDLQAHGNNGHSEDEFFTINGKKYVVCISQTPASSGTYETVDWIE